MKVGHKFHWCAVTVAYCGSCTFVLLYLAVFCVFLPDIRHVNTFRNQLEKMCKQVNSVDRRHIRNSIRGIWRTRRHM
jgi:hypothetical protein